MTAPELRPYQRDVIREFYAKVEAGHRRVLLVAPTGAGKTVAASAIARDMLDQGQRVLFLCHRRELVKQASEKLFDYGIDAGIIQAGFSPRPGERAQVASIATLHTRAIRHRTIDLPRADLVIVDEAHHVRARTWRELLDRYPLAAVLGVTATPCRGDGKGLGNVFDAMIECPSVGELIALEFLVGTRVYAPTMPDLKGVRVELGDYVEKQLAERMDRAELVGDIVTHWHRLADRQRTVLFASGVAHSVHLRDEFRKSGVRAEHIDATTPKDQRDAILAQLGAGDIELVSNAMILTEGWDRPEVSCCVLARPTRHIGLYRQMVGRVLRPWPGKDAALILDHAGAVFQHGFAEDKITWTLDTDRRAENLAHAGRVGSFAEGSRLTTCPRCSAVRLAGEPCGACGWQPQRRPQAVEIVDGQLGEVDRDRHAHALVDTPAVRQRWHSELASIAADRSYKPGWVAHKFKERFGTWPARWPVAPSPPSPEVKSWVRSRNIAYAKQRAKEPAQ